ncbi:MAG: type IX secretion system sortase PorU, partial [Bacteroidales bacterium]|nr:type IX secretion system sortase PorU [Bacteroidales bacterium]
LSEKNTDFRYDDLVENSIYVEGEADDNFGKNDFIVFYAKGPAVWYYDTTETRFEHKKNLYSDYSYYFLNFNSTEGKRVEKADFKTTNPDFVVESFNDFDFYEKDNVNLIKSGKEWYGEIFDIITNYSFGFSFADIDKNTDINIKIAVAARSTAISSFRYVVNGNIFSQSVSSIPPNSYNYDYAKNATGIFKFKTTSDNINLTINYDNSASGSIGWLNYIELNLKRNLIFRNGQLSFRDAASVGKNNVAEFKIKNATPNLTIWDVSDINNIKSIKGTLSNNVLSFVQPTSLLKEFVAFDYTSFYTPEIMGQVQNQNLHSLKNIDLVIVSYKDYLAEAGRLAELHKKYDSLSVVIVTPQEIYNEFSSGAQDISAIRDFMKMLYDRAANQDEAPKYLLLFGSASYDYKSRMKNNKNLVPTYESNVSLLPTSSYVTDDYYGLLDDNEGENSNGDLDLGIGRFPVNTIQQAKEAVDKVYRYYANNFLPAAKSSTDNIIPNLADWRNIICFVADDEDSNLHISQSEQLAINLENNYKQFNIDKIYFDSYKQISTPGGQRYPEVNAAINQRMEKGALLINYTGHGGEVGWSHERVLEISDINNWTNTYNMPVFLTATCEFSRFDDPERTSAGEYVYLNSNGGAIALFTTTRLAYSNSNYTLNRNFFENAFKKVNNKFYTMGDIIRQAKVLSGSTIYIRNFVLLGDPVLRMAIPEYKVITDSVNHKPVNLSISDSLKAMSAISISGRIIDQNGMLADKFNGVVYPLIYDKAATISTLANDAASFVKNFQIQKNIIYKGVIPVVNGLFSFDFIVPKDIMYNFGNGKISYYATDSVRDANGYYDNIIIGGSLTDNIADTKGPNIKLFIDNESFVSGGNTGVNPLLIAHIEDQSGVNMTGNGIGHDITAFLNNTSQQEIVLNDYYHYDLGTYKKGKINYKFSG